MTFVEQRSSVVTGAFWALGGMLLFSVNDMSMKFLSGDYPLHEIIFVRGIVGVVAVLAILMPLAGGVAAMRTRRPGVHIIRAVCVVMSNMLFFVGLADMPLAEAVAVFFVAPFLISMFSKLFLGEAVGPRRWAAIAAGLLGVMIVLRPGTEAFQPASILVLGSAVFYAGLQTFTRRVGATESALVMVFYVQVAFLVTAIAVGLTLGHGGFSGSGHPSLEFLLRAWIWPTPADLGIMVIIGVVTVFGGYAIVQAYRSADAALIAPLEYTAMPLSVMWGFVVFGELPDAVAIAGIALVIGSGMVLIWREAVQRRSLTGRPMAPR